MHILVLNVGSSTIKFSLFAFSGESNIRPILRGTLKGIGGEGELQVDREQNERKIFHKPVKSLSQGLTWVFETLQTYPESSRIQGVGHRVVHGGSRYSSPVILNDEVLLGIETLAELAPLHNPPSLEGIRLARHHIGSTVPMVAVFDTAYYANMPKVARQYAVPSEFTKKHHIIRYGFHGIAHASMMNTYDKVLEEPIENRRVITLHLGSGCSATAIAKSQPIDTSMGFTPLEGLVMGTRSGDIDPSIVEYLANKEQASAGDVVNLLNRESGLLGLSGRTQDMKELLRLVSEEKDARAQLAVDLFCYRIKKYIGAYLAALGGCDALLIGGGIGEHAPEIRAQVCQGMGWCGMQISDAHNEQITQVSPGQIQKISSPESKIKVWVVGVDEEYAIAQETARILGGNHERVQALC